MESNPAVGLLGFWMMLQLAATLAILLGGIYALFCLGRAASGLDRMASALEEWVAAQNTSEEPMLPSAPFSHRVAAARPVQAQPFTPPVPAATAAPAESEYSSRDEFTS
jgi:hypothetical protein